MTVELDRLVAREVARLHLQGGCGCRACRGSAFASDEKGGRDEAAPPRAARSATRPSSGGTAMPRWRGWSAPVSLARLKQAWADRRTTPVPPELAPFFRTGSPNIYRITRSGVDRARPLTIGMTQGAKSILQRVREHHGEIGDGDPKVRGRIQNLDDSRVLVQAGRLAGHPDVRDAHGYEIWLQVREDPQIYEPDTRTFDEAEL